MKKVWNTAVSDAFFVISEINKRIFSNSEPFFAKTLENVDSLQYLFEIPFQSYGGEEIHKTDSEKYAAIFYHTIKDHKFENGNKRTGVILLMMLAIVNGSFPDMTPHSLYEEAVKVAESAPTDKDIVFARLVRYFREHIKPVKR